MKGDIKLELKINKKIGLFLLGGMSLFAAADFVSMVDLKSSGGITVVQETMNVGSVVFRIDDKNPSTIYGGVWELVTGDANITLGDGSDLSALLITGQNEQTVVLPEHNHSINHDHPSVTTNTDTHSHTQYVGQSGSGYSGRSGWNVSGPYYGLGSFGQTASDSHNHTVNLPNFNGTSGNKGTPNAKMDVRGARLALNVWKRVS